MRIAFISYEYPPDTPVGGIGVYTYQLAKMLAGVHFHVHVFAGSHIASAKSFENYVTVQRIHCSGPHDFQKKVVLFFKQEHLSNPFHLIESPEIHANALEIKRMFPFLTLIVRLHAPNHLIESLKKSYVPYKNKWRFFFGALRRGRWDMGYWRKYNYKNDVDYAFTQMANQVSAPTLQMKNWAVKNWNIAPERITVIENPFIENALFKVALTNNEEKKIIFYGRLNVLKGLVTATKAMKHILKNNPAWKWIVVGDDGPAANAKDSMMSWVKEHLQNVIGQVSFYKSVPNDQIPNYLQQASIVLIPSLFESYSYVTVEAMSAGKAVIGSRHTGIESLVEDNVTGMLADPYNINEWRRKIQQLVNDKELRKCLGKAAYGYMENKYSVNRQVIDFYKSITSLIPVKT